MKKQRHYFANKGLSSQSYGFCSSYVWMWEVDHKESWALKNWCFWTVVLEKTVESHLDCKEIKPVNSKGNQSWIFIGRTDAEAPIFWPSDVKNWFIGKDPDAGKDWRWEEKGIDAFELWCWRRLLRVTWTARRSNHSILKEISPEYSLEGLMLKLKLQYSGHLI